MPSDMSPERRALLIEAMKGRPFAFELPTDGAGDYSVSAPECVAINAALDAVPILLAALDAAEAREKIIREAYAGLLTDYDKYSQGHAEMPFSNFRLALVAFLDDMDIALAAPAAPAAEKENQR